MVRQLEQGGLDLDASLKLWERGEELAKRCEEHLAGAREKVEKALAVRETTTTLEHGTSSTARGSKLEHVSVILAAWVTQR